MFLDYVNWRSPTTLIIFKTFSSFSVFSIIRRHAYGTKFYFHKKLKASYAFLLPFYCLTKTLSPLHNKENRNLRAGLPRMNWVELFFFFHRSLAAITWIKIQCKNWCKLPSKRKKCIPYFSQKIWGERLTHKWYNNKRTDFKEKV